MIVCATIIRNGMVLLVRQSGRHKPTYGHWVLPAGRAEGSEGLEEALRREMQEELSLNVEIACKILEHIDPYTGDALINFLCRPLTSEIFISAELAEAKWFNLKEIERTHNMDLDLKQFLIDGLKRDWQ